MTHSKAKIESFYHGSAIDGEGLRSVIFFSGCNLKCPFCHNPETLFANGDEYTVDESVLRIMRYRNYIDGVTFSGGEPFLQADFCVKLANKLKKEGLTVIAETNGMIIHQGLIDVLDGIIIDVKNQENQPDDLIYEKYFEFLSVAKQPIVLTNVIVPDVNDNSQSLSILKRLKAEFSQVNEIKLLPFKKICKTKYDSLKKDFPYNDKKEATLADIGKAYDILSDL